MHIPLLIHPGKPKRSARKPLCSFGSRCATASLLLGVCVLAALFGEYDTKPQEAVILSAPAREASPVKYVTVTTTIFGIGEYEQFVPPSRKQTSYVRRSTHQMPLLELYDELSKMGERALNETRISHMAGLSLREMKKIYLRFQKEFAAKYGLTLKDVTLLRQEGCRQNHGTEFCALSFIADILEKDGKAFTKKYGVTLGADGEFRTI